MITLAKYPAAKAKKGYDRTQAYYKIICENAQSSSGLRAAQITEGFLTVEDTPGMVNFNPLNKMVKVVFYQHDPHTRYGYYAKFRITPQGLEEL